MVDLIEMNVMTAKVFVDTNIVLYLIGIETKKKNISRDIIATHPMLSTQVVN
jgi:predicted nucleic acid-binding protein